MAEKGGGYVKLYRSIFANEFLAEKPFDAFHAWVWLIGNANYAEASRRHKGELQTIRRGQLCVSYAYLAEAWGWSPGKVRRFIRQLKRQTMVHTDSTTHGTTITIEKYEFFQSERQTKRQTDDTTDGPTDGTTDGTQKKKVKKEKKEEEGRNTPPPSSDNLSNLDFLDEVLENWAEKRKRKEAGHDDGRN